LLKLLRHQLGSEPPTGLVDDAFLHAGDSFYHIHGSPAKYILHVIQDLYKPTLGEALPHLGLHASTTPLQPFVGDLPVGGSFGFVSFLDLDVVGHFVKGLSVRMLF
jgi:hypothetical protein